MSRLNAQYVFMSSPTGRDVCEYLRNVCTLPDSAVIVPPDTATPQSQSQTQSSDILDRAENCDVNEEFCGMDGSVFANNEAEAPSLSKKFAAGFNEKVERLFGKYEIVANKFSRNSNTDQQQDEHFEGEGCTGQEDMPNFIPGKLEDLFQMHCDWGRDLRYIYIY